MTTKTERRCANRKCRNPMPGRRANAIYCSPACSSQVAYAKRNSAAGTDEEVYVCLGCKYPKQPQAEIIEEDQARRHPYAGKRPVWSGYCADPYCTCKVCRPEGPRSDPRPQVTASDAPGRCPLPRLPGKLAGKHRRQVADGTVFCSCAKPKGVAA